MYGTFAIVQGAVGILSALLYGLYVVVFVGMSQRTGQLGTTCLLITTVFCFVGLAFFWEVAAPTYPMVVMGCIMGQVVGNTTFYVVYPLISVFYGGWLVSPVRAGTDASGMITTFVAEAQNPSGSHNLFDAKWLFLGYAALSSLGVGLWLHIVHSGLGLRAPVEQGSSGEEECHKEAFDGDAVNNTSGESSSEDLSQPSSHCGRYAVWACWQLRGFSCSRELVVPIALATATQVGQWALSCNLGQIGASMTDPKGCEGSTAAWVWRTSLTVSNVMVPIGSIASSIAWCPRWLYVVLALLQYACAGAVCSAALGIGRGFWTSSVGQYWYISAFGITACLEGYLLTMCYRYIGDNEDLSASLRQSSSNLLSLLGVLAVNPVAIIFGSLVSSRTVACVPP